MKETTKIWCICACWLGRVGLLRQLLGCVVGLGDMVTFYLSLDRWESKKSRQRPNNFNLSSSAMKGIIQMLTRITSSGALCTGSSVVMCGFSIRVCNLYFVSYLIWGSDAKKIEPPAYNVLNLSTSFIRKEQLPIKFTRCNVIMMLTN